MKRSEINKALKELEKMIADHQYYLPKFANFTPEEWKTIITPTRMGIKFTV